MMYYVVVVIHCCVRLLREGHSSCSVNIQVPDIVFHLADNDGNLLVVLGYHRMLAAAVSIES